MDQLLYELREKVRSEDIQVVFADLRTGIRDESTCEHETWLECSRVINWCKQESLGLCFLSLQGDKYGYTPLPKVLSQRKLNEHLAATNCPEETRKLVYEWYAVDENAIREREVVLRNLQTANDPSYWRVFDVILDAIRGVAFDEERYEGLKAGCSITEWEVRAALDKFPVDVLSSEHKEIGVRAVLLVEKNMKNAGEECQEVSSGVSRRQRFLYSLFGRDSRKCGAESVHEPENNENQGKLSDTRKSQCSAVCWSHRHACGEVSSREYCDGMCDHVTKLKQFMYEKIPSHGIQKCELKSQVDLLASESEGFKVYFDRFTFFCRNGDVVVSSDYIEESAVDGRR